MKDIIIRLSRNFELDPLLVAAIIEQESAGDSFSGRYEPDYMSKYIAPKSRDRLGGTWLPERICSEKTERCWRATSWGVMHVIGQTARELGFTDVLLRLIEPQNGIFYGAKYLRHCLDKHKGDEDAGITAYNGVDPEYPVHVRAHIASGAAARHLR